MDLSLESVVEYLPVDCFLAANLMMSQIYECDLPTRLPGLPYCIAMKTGKALHPRS